MGSELKFQRISTSHHLLRDHATQRLPSKINPAVMALLKSRLPCQEQAAQSQVQAQQVAPTTSSLRAHAASVNVCINTVMDILVSIYII